VANYRIVITRSAAKELEDIPRKDRAKIVAKIQTLASDPRPSGSEKLAGDDKYRLRQGNYRVLYHIDDDAIVVTVVRIAHRREVYR
jgi:mRNA interferase RelE/StbE